MQNEQILANAVASVEMEGFFIDEKCKTMCCKLLSDEITFDEYMQFVICLNGI